MATNKIGFPSYDSWVGYAEESTFGTAIADGEGFTIFKMLDNNTPGFTPEGYMDEAIKNQEKNIIDKDDFHYTENGEWQTYAMPTVIASSGDLAHLLYAACQAVSEAVGSPFLKTYAMDGTTKPDFSSNAGYFATILINEPLSSFSKKLTSCVLQNLTITFNAADGGRCKAAGTWLTGKGFDDASNPSGTNAHSSVAVPNFHNSTASTLTINALDLIWYEVVFNITNQFAWIGNSAGVAENYALIGQTVTANCIVKYDNNSDAFTNQKGETGLANFDFNIGDETAAGDFSADCNDILLRNVTFDRGGTDEVQKLNLEFLFMNDYGAGQSITFKVADGVDRTW